ncbi:MAG TPA: hypothetical protein VK745_21525 [Polyangiaceae bacterium]|nr:hypothetical protein [Polyangiaceae bacterium]
MSDPKHLTDEGADATDLERELLLAAREVGLSAAEKRAIWASVALHALPTATVSVAPGGAAAKVGLSLSPWLKGLLVVLSLGGVSAGIYRWRQPQAPLAQVSASSSATLGEAAPLSAPVPAQPATAASDTPNAAVLEAPSASGAASNTSRDASPIENKSALREESVAVLEIRRTLRAGDASGALRLLEQARQRFPHGALSQEREALSIEALAKSGSRDAAARKADAFLRAHPKSPYAADVQSFQNH